MLAISPRRSQTEEKETWYSSVQKAPPAPPRSNQKCNWNVERKFQHMGNSHNGAIGHRNAIELFKVSEPMTPLTTESQTKESRATSSGKSPDGTHEMRLATVSRHRILNGPSPGYHLWHCSRKCSVVGRAHSLLERMSLFHTNCCRNKQRNLMCFVCIGTYVHWHIDLAADTPVAKKISLMPRPVH